MATVGQLIIEMGADVARLRKDMGDATSIIKSFQSSAESAFKGVATAAAGYLSFQGMAQIFKATVDAYAEEERGLLRLEAVLRAHGITNKEVTRIYNDMANELQLTTRYTDDQIRASQELLTTMGVTPGKMREVVLASAALASRTGDLESASKLMGQAAEGNFERLGRIIPVLKGVEKGSLDFNAVMKIIQQSFGDIAQREMEGYSGQVAKLKTEWKEFGEDMGSVVVPALTTVLKTLREIWTSKPDSELIQAGMASPFMASDIQNGEGRTQALKDAEKRMKDIEAAANQSFLEQQDKNFIKIKVPNKELIDDLKKAWENYYKEQGKLAGDTYKESLKAWEDFEKEQISIAEKDRETGLKQQEDDLADYITAKAKQLEEINALELQAAEFQKQITQSVFDDIISMANAAGEYGQGPGLMAANLKKFEGATSGQDEWTAKLTNAEDYYTKLKDMASGSAAYEVELEDAALALTEMKKSASASRQAKIYSSMFGMMSGAAMSFYQASGKQNKVAFDAYKAFAIAETVISTIAATQAAYKTGLNATGTMGGGVAFAAVAAIAGAARVAQIASTSPDNTSASLSGTSAGGYTYSDPNTPTWEKDKTETGRTVNIYVYGNVIDHQQFARDVVPYLDQASADGVH